MGCFNFIKIEMSSNLKVYMAMTFIQISFSGWHVMASKILGDGVNAYVLSLYREIFSTILMFLLSYYHDGFTSKF